MFSGHGDVQWENRVEDGGGGETLASVFGDIKEGQNGPSGLGHSQVKSWKNIFLGNFIDCFYLFCVERCFYPPFKILKTKTCF